MQTDFQPSVGENETLIEVRDLCASYRGHTVFRDVNFDVAKGEIFVIAGGSGCGKSTLMKHMIGLYRPERGKILIGGENLHESSAAGREAILRKIGPSLYRLYKLELYGKNHDFLSQSPFASLFTC